MTTLSPRNSVSPICRSARVPMRFNFRISRRDNKPWRVREFRRVHQARFGAKWPAAEKGAAGPRLSLGLEGDSDGPRESHHSAVSAARQLHDLVRRNSRTGFEASNHYSYTVQDLREKG